MERLFIVITSLLLVACASTGGTIGGLIPAPKNLKGSIENDTYYISQNNEFRVMLPHPPSLSDTDKYEWRYTNVEEVSDQDKVVGAIFGPAAADLNRYHAVLIKVATDSDLKKYVSNVFARKASSRSNKLRNIHQEEFHHKGMESFYSVYESPNTFLVLSLVSQGEYFYVIEVDVNKKSGRALPTKEQLTNRDWDIFNHMFDSFKVNKPIGH